MGVGRGPRAYCNGMLGWELREAAILHSVAAAVCVAVLFAGLPAGLDPLFPLVVGDEGDGDQEEHDETEEEFHD